jgi:hypothetical protein
VNVEARGMTMFNMSRNRFTLVRASVLLATLGGLVLVDWALAADATPKAAARDESKFLCSMDGKINSIGAVVEDNGRAFRCTTVFEERGVSRAAWVQVRMTASLVTD